MPTALLRTSRRESDVRLDDSIPIAGNRVPSRQRGHLLQQKGSPWLRAPLDEAAQAARRIKDTYLGAQYRQLAGRKGKKRAAIAVGHRILVVAHHLLRPGEP